MEAEVVYRFHIALRGVGPKVRRPVEMRAASSLADPAVNGATQTWIVRIHPKLRRFSHSAGSPRKAADERLEAKVGIERRA
jgi:hypothetical protein